VKLIPYLNNLLMYSIALPLQRLITNIRQLPIAPQSGPLREILPGGTMTDTGSYSFCGPRWKAIDKLDSEKNLRKF